MNDAIPLWICPRCGHQSGGKYVALCQQPAAGGKGAYGRGTCDGVIRGLPRGTDEPLMGWLRWGAPDHAYRCDDEIILSWLHTKHLEMYLPHQEEELLAWLREFEPKRFSELQQIVRDVEHERKRLKQLPAHGEWQRQAATG